MIGSIYKIIHLDSEIQYIGSTAGTVNDRWYQHKNSYKNWLSNKEKYKAVSIYPYFERFGIDRFKMILIKSYKVVDKHHLYVYEQLAMNRTKCVNQQSAIQLINQNCMSKHYKDNNRDKMKEYYQQNKQSILEQQKQYKEANKQSISTRKKHYYQANRDKYKEYYEQNKQSIIEKKLVKVTCECGVTISKNSLSDHKKTQKHLTLLAAQTN